MQRLYQDDRRRNGAPAADIGAAAAAALRMTRRRKFCAPSTFRPAKSSGNTPQDGPGETWAGTLSTASGLVFYGDDGGELAAADAATGKKLWSFPFTESLHTSPMTYMFDNKQYVGMVVGSVVYAFGLAE